MTTAARKLPAQGFGTYGLYGEECTAAVLDAVAAGYTLIDTAASYGNEAAVGAAVAQLPRDQVFVTTKVRGAEQGYVATLKGVLQSAKRLQVRTLDLVLIHWPLPRLGLAEATWRELIELRERGVVKHLGVSNFLPQQIEDLVDDTGVWPEVNQIEVHPFFAQEKLVRWNQDHSITVQGWSPLGRHHDILEHPVIRAGAAAAGCTPAQLVLAWHHSRGVVAIPKTASAQRRRENLAATQLQIDPEILATFAELPQQRLGGDPLLHEEF